MEAEKCPEYSNFEEMFNANSDGIMDIFNDPFFKDSGSVIVLE